MGNESPQLKHQTILTSPPIVGDDEYAALDLDRAVENLNTESIQETTALEWVATNAGDSRHSTVGIEYDGRGLTVIGLSKKRGTDRSIDHVLVTEYDEPPTSSVIAERLRALVRHRNPEVNIVLSTTRAVVRNFLIPAVPVRQREAAALWQGQKLIPFTLQDGGALYGLEYVPTADRGWRATLVAVPTEDASPILDAVESLGWKLKSISLVGTQHLGVDARSTSDSATATLSWSNRRGCFAVHLHDLLIFHYDLGPMPVVPSGLGSDVTPESMPRWQRWTDSLGVTVTDALDFHLNVNPTLPPLQLHLYGLPPAVAPLLTEWNARFPDGVVLADPLSGCLEGVPEGVRTWLSSHLGVVAPVMGALRGRVSNDLTPKSLRAQRVQFQRERIARSACVITLLACAIWAALLWAHISEHRAESQAARNELTQLESSPASQKLDQVMLSTARTQLMLAAATEPGRAWSPWLKSILTTLPQNAYLNRLVAEHRSDQGRVTALLEGSLHPGPVPYAITYREWFDRMRSLSPSAPILVNERSIDVYGAKHSAFTIELIAPSESADSRKDTK